MVMEKEITIKVNVSYEQLHNSLNQQGFKIIEEYQLDDIYLVPKNMAIVSSDVLEMLNKCVLIRKIGEFKKSLTYKYKKYADNGDIIEQGKTECQISNIEDALEFMKAIGYKRLLNIKDKITVYSNNKLEFAVQQVNNKYVFIEMEDKNEHTGKNYDTIEEMIADINSVKIDYDHSNYFVKKAIIVFNDLYSK